MEDKLKIHNDLGSWVASTTIRFEPEINVIPPAIIHLVEGILMELFSCYHYTYPKIKKKPN